MRDGRNGIVLPARDPDELAESLAAAILSLSADEAPESLLARLRTGAAEGVAVRPLAEQLITKAKRGDLHSRRQVVTVLRQELWHGPEGSFDKKDNGNGDGSPTAASA